MRLVAVSFTGGPLDGTERAERVPDHWKYLRYEHCDADKVHIYYGPLRSRRHLARLDYLGVERREVPGNV